MSLNTRLATSAVQNIRPILNFFFEDLLNLATNYLFIILFANLSISEVSPVSIYFEIKKIFIGITEYRVQPYTE